MLLDYFLIVGDELLQGRDWNLMVELDARRVAGGEQQVLKLLQVDAQHDIAEYLDEAPVGVEREPPVGGELCQTFDGLLV